MRYKNLIIAAAFSMFCACTNDSDSISDESTGQTIQFEASFSDAATRTTMDGTGKVTWGATDEIQVNNATGP